MQVNFKMNEAEHYGGRGAGSFFQLKNDKDTARVRFMYNGIDDIYGYAVHQVTVEGKQRYVARLREYTQPIDDCPFCKAKISSTRQGFSYSSMMLMRMKLRFGSEEDPSFLRWQALLVGIIH